ncbi:MAG: TMEM175 family protein [Candidatus Dormibacteraceae bacterium]
MNKSRVEAFSDGVFAVASTLLVFNLVAPRVTHGLDAALLSAWPSYAAYAISFGTIIVIWVNHHVVFENIERVDRRLLFINALLLLTVAAIPFPTGLLAQYLQAGHDQQTAAFAYGLTMSAMAVAFSLVTLYARRYRRTYVPLDWVGFATGLVLYPLATLVALADFRFALAIYGFIVVFYLALPILREYLDGSGYGASPHLAHRRAGATESNGRDLGEDA